MRFSVEEMEEAYFKLNERANIKGAETGCLIGFILAAACYYFIEQLGQYVLYSLWLPPLLVGLLSQAFGRNYRWKERLPAGLLGAFVHILGCIYLNVNFVCFLFTPVAFLISFSMAKVALQRVDVWAIDFAEQGKISTGIRYSRFKDAVKGKFIETFNYQLTVTVKNMENLFEGATQEQIEGNKRYFHIFRFDYYGETFELKLSDDLLAKKYEADTEYMAFFDPNDKAHCWFERKVRPMYSV